MTVGAILVCTLTLFGFSTWRFSGMDEFEDDGAATGEEDDIWGTTVIGVTLAEEDGETAAGDWAEGCVTVVPSLFPFSRSGNFARLLYKFGLSLAKITCYGVTFCHFEISRKCLS